MVTKLLTLIGRQRKTPVAQRNRGLERLNSGENPPDSDY
jgi:hypothetical protein